MQTKINVSIVVDYEDGMPGKTTATLEVDSGGFNAALPAFSAPKPWRVFEKVGEFFAGLTEAEFLAFTGSRK